MQILFMSPEIHPLTSYLILWGNQVQVSQNELHECIPRVKQEVSVFALATNFVTCVETAGTNYDLFHL